jgi:hypothetical protein
VGTTRQLVCFCEHSFEAEVPERVDLAENPEVEDQILSGEFLAVRCPACGKVLKPEFPVFVRDAQAERTILLVPELDRAAFFRGRLSYGLGDASRVAIGYEELAEKFLIKRAGLDDRVVELIKYYLLRKLLDDFEGDQEVRLLFSRMEGQTLVFNALGLKQGEVGVLRVPADTLHKAEAQLEQKLGQEPLGELLRGPYVSVNKLYAEGEE